MKRHHSRNSIRARLQALGFGVAIAGSLLATTAGTTLAKVAPPTLGSDERTIPDQVLESLEGVTWAASKVAAQADFYLGLNDVPAAAPGGSSGSGGSHEAVPHQVAPVE